MPLRIRAVWAVAIVAAAMFGTALTMRSLHDGGPASASANRPPETRHPDGGGAPPAPRETGSAPQRAPQEPGSRLHATPKRNLVPYTGPVEHIFFHPLIAYPELAFDGDPIARGYDDWFVTVQEFQKILEALYRNDYILIRIDDLFAYRTVDGRPFLEAKELLLPAGKKPLIISVDDLNYYRYMRENGNVFKLVLDDEGRVATYSVTPDGQERVARDNEIIPILDAFVEDHPDFSFRGAKGIIALTGYEGILGYRTDDPTAPNYEQEKQAALAVVRRLKDTGWTFASHGWGHLAMWKVRHEVFVRDTQRWKQEVEPLVGPTSVYVYPYGQGPLPGDPRFRYLLNAGFRVICLVGPSPYRPQSGPYAIMERRHVDGVALRTQRRQLLHLFDAHEVIDPVRPSR